MSHARAGESSPREALATVARVGSGRLTSSRRPVLPRHRSARLGVCGCVGSRVRGGRRAGKTALVARMLLTASVKGGSAAPSRAFRGRRDRLVGCCPYVGYDRWQPGSEAVEPITPPPISAATSALNPGPAADEMRSPAVPPLSRLLMQLPWSGLPAPRTLCVHPTPSSAAPSVRLPSAFSSGSPISLLGHRSIASSLPARRTADPRLPGKAAGATCGQAWTGSGSVRTPRPRRSRRRGDRGAGHAR